MEGCSAVHHAKGVCIRHYRDGYYKANKETLKQYKQRYRQANKHKARETSYQLFYNLNPREYDVMKEYQAADSRYRILLGKKGQKTRDHIEHRHSDGMIRGVMASMLNRAYGLIERLYPNNTAEVLRALAYFHENPPAPKALGETVYGLMGQAQRKKRMLYGPDGRREPFPRTLAVSALPPVDVSDR